MKMTSNQLTLTIDHPLQSKNLTDLKSSPNLAKKTATIKRNKNVEKKRRRLKKVRVSTARNARGRRANRGTSHVGRFWNGAAVVKHLPVGKYAIGTSKYLSKSTQFAIVDTSAKIGKKGNWLLRFDKPHKGVDFSHVNVNPKLTGIKDPHLQIPDSAVTAASGLNKTAKVVGKVALVASLAFDAYRIGSAAHGDIKGKGKLGKETGKTVASVGSGYAGGAAGVFGGNALGAWIGGGIGTLFGGVGAVPGAAIGSIVGSVIGGIGGAIGGSVAAEKIVDVVVSDSDDYEDISSDEDNNNNKNPEDKPGFIKQGGAIVLHATVNNVTKVKPRKKKLVKKKKKI